MNAMLLDVFNGYPIAVECIHIVVSM